MKCKRPLCAACLAVILLIAAGVYLRPPTFFSYEEAAGREVRLTGRVCEKEQKQGYGAPVLVLILKPERLVCETQDIPFKDNFICMLREGEPEPAVGSTVTVVGTLEEYEPPSNPGQFDSRTYYAIQGVSARIKKACLEEDDGRISYLREGLWKLKCALREQIGETFDEETASLLDAMLLGDKTALPSDTKKLYRTAGILHILSISGFHISILGVGLFKLLGRLRLPVIPAAVCCGLFMICYGIMVGMPVSACRAIGMFLIDLFAKCIGRTSDTPTSLSLLAASILVAQPLYLYHAGFWLSFTSVLALCTLRPVLLADVRQGFSAARWRRSAEGGAPVSGGRLWQALYAGPVDSALRGRLWQALYAAADGFCTGLSILLFTLPIQLIFYYEIPLSGVILNLIVLPLLSVAIFAGMGAAALAAAAAVPVEAAAVPIAASAWFPAILIRLSGLTHWLSGVLARLTEFIFSLYGKCASFAAKLDCCVWTPGRPSPWQIAVYLAVLAAALLMRGLKGRYRMGLLLGAALVFGISFHSGMTVTFLDVGQGDCACLELPDGQTWLVDCGSTSAGGVGEYRLLPFLKYRGITQIEAVFVSHADADHINGLQELLADEQMHVDMLALPAGHLGDEGFAALLALAEERNISVLSLSAGMEWTSGEVYAACLHPCGSALQDVGPGGTADVRSINGALDVRSVNEALDARSVNGALDMQSSGGTFSDTRRGSASGAARASSSGDSNADSEVLYISYRDFSILFAGDVEGLGEDALTDELQRRQLGRITVLKVAHHGSKNSTSEEFLQVVRPALALISSGQGNRYGHPHRETLTRLEDAGAAVLRTDESGAIILNVRGGKLLMQKFGK